MKMGILLNIVDNTNVIAPGRVTLNSFDSSLEREHKRNIEDISHLANAQLANCRSMSMMCVCVSV